MKIQNLIINTSFFSLLTSSAFLNAAEQVGAMTLQQLCEPLPIQASSQQIQAREQCTKQIGPKQIANYFTGIYQKTAGKLSLQYLDNSKLELEDFVEDDPERYQVFSLWGCDASKRYCVIYKAGWERWRYLLVDRKSKITTELTGYPVFSPDSQLVFEYLDSRISETFSRNIIKLYRLTAAQPKLLLSDNGADFGVQSAKWLSATTLEAKLQHFAANDFSRYIEAGAMQLVVNGDEVKMTVEKAAKQ